MTFYCESCGTMHNPAELAERDPSEGQGCRRCGGELWGWPGSWRRVVLAKCPPRNTLATCPRCNELLEHDGLCGQCGPQK